MYGTYLDGLRQVVTVTFILLFYQNVTRGNSLEKELSSLQIFSTVNVCERTEILKDIKNIQSQVIECLDKCQEQKYTGLPDKNC